MTATIPELVRDAALSFTFEVRSATVALVAIIVLVVLLSVREVARAHGGTHAAERMETLGVAVWPLLLVFGVAVIVRMVQLL
jgi:hypothetical protein